MPRDTSEGGKSALKKGGNEERTGAPRGFTKRTRKRKRGEIV